MVTSGVYRTHRSGIRTAEDNIRNLYRFIVYNYDPGDDLYFFGFSRGAFTVRTLAGFMNKVGLIEKDDDYYVPELYDCYSEGKLLPRSSNLGQHLARLAAKISGVQTQPAKKKFSLFG